MIARVARSQAPVHISGESGTGKELVAKLIHESGPRRDGPFVPVNCGAIPTELMESELFGHKRGSFTGAVSDKKGLIQSAEGGTLFLDEIADLPLHMQVKLLRVIQEKAVRPVGEQPRSASTCAFCRPPTRTCRNWSPKANSAKICFTGSTSSNCACRRCASDREDVPELAEAVLRRLGPAHEDHAADARQGRAGRARSLCISGQCAGAREYSGARHHLEHERRDQCRGHSTAALRRAEPSARRESASGGAVGRSSGGHRARRHRQGARTDPIQQDRRRKVLGMCFRALRYRIKKLGIE